ncbi:hypothetical protein L0222_29520 [bacterium]|nr:hypothetical protein [bacterium]
MKKIQPRSIAFVFMIIVAFALAYYGCRTKDISKTTSVSGSLEEFALSRDFSPEEAKAALETFVAPGKFDEFVMFTSGGHSGSVYLHGLPSMRLLKEIPVYAPNSWQGWAQGTEESMKVLREGTFSPSNPNLPVQTWGDLHHPQLSQTNGDYDGEWCFVSDKPTGRIAVIDLRDFKTKQIVKTPNILSDHAVFLVGNTDYVVNSTFQPSHFGERSRFISSTARLAGSNWRNRFRWSFLLTGRTLQSAEKA